MQDARTGIMEAQFSVAEVMSVADMNGMTRKEAWTSERLQAGAGRSSKRNDVNAAIDGPISSIGIALLR